MDVIKGIAFLMLRQSEQNQRVQIGNNNDNESNKKQQNGCV